jgi:hypothetical protein
MAAAPFQRLQTPLVGLHPRHPLLLLLLLHLQCTGLVSQRRHMHLALRFRSLVEGQTHPAAARTGGCLLGNLGGSYPALSNAAWLAPLAPAARH